jgi:hypothetical protein
MSISQKTNDVYKIIFLNVPEDAIPRDLVRKTLSTLDVMMIRLHTFNSNLWLIRCWIKSRSFIYIQLLNVTLENFVLQKKTSFSEQKNVCNTFFGWLVLNYTIAVRVQYYFCKWPFFWVAAYICYCDEIWKRLLRTKTKQDRGSFPGTRITWNVGNSQMQYGQLRGRIQSIIIIYVTVGPKC